MDPSIRETIRGRRRIYLLRHGDVDYFDADRRPCHPARVVLSAAGRRQAAAAAEALRAAPIDRLVSSGLPRTDETAEALLAGRELELERRPGLREIEPGTVERLDSPGFQERFVAAFRRGVEDDESFLGGETYGAHRSRVLAELDALLREDDWRELAVVAHGGSNRVVLAHALGGGAATFAALEQDPGAINVVDVDPDGAFVVRLVNFTPEETVKLGLRLTTMERILGSWLGEG